MRKKQDLPSKLCACCGLPFTWRKKWERDWESVKFCSDRCRQQGAGKGEGTGKAAGGGGGSRGPVTTASSARHTNK